MKKILILASNPRKDLNLDQEIRDLKGVIERSPSREQFEVVTELAVRVADLQELMLKHEPQIVHFCGHGGGAEGLVFVSDEAKEQRLSTRAFSGLLSLCARHVECVLLNACYSEVQAYAMIAYINYVIGMSQTIQDDAAIAFAKGFYRALGYDQPIEEAYKFGCNAIQLEITGSSKVRSTATEAERKATVVDTVKTTAIPEHLKPILKKKVNLEQKSPTPALSEEDRAALQVEVAQSLESSSMEKFRDRVREYLADHKLSALEEIRLERLRKDLGLSEGEANQLVVEEQAPILKARDEYEEMLLGLIEAWHYPFNSEISEELQDHVRDLGLTEEEEKTVSEPILKAAEQEYQEQSKAQEQRRQQEEHQANLQRYEQEFCRAISGKYPIDTFVRDGLKTFQQSLGLSDGEVEQIEQPLIAPKEAAYQQQVAEALQREREAERQQAQRNQELERQRELAQQRQEEERRKKEEATAKGQQRQAEGRRRKKEATAKSLIEALGNGVTLEMVQIPAGTFLMGSPDDEKGRYDREGPQHQVTVSTFLMGKFAVTQAQWRSVAAQPKVNRDLDPDPSSFKGANLPVEKVSWADAVEFCDRLNRFVENRLSCETGKSYRLPSEAEWEYACRAGTETPFHYGETITPDLANYDGNHPYGAGLKGLYRQQTTDVGSFPPNAFGLYDMHGNVWEWCADHWHDNYKGFFKKAPADGSACVTGNKDSWRLLRGGSWYLNPRNCRSACRGSNAPGDRNNNIGFRVVCEARGL
ncbi:MAG: SUMF1/EgtB/PvdO family nonheme iron enzyme [Phormidesmis sp.]